MASLSPRSSPLGRPLAAHLLRRATFGPNRQEITQFASKSPADAVAILMKQTSRPQPPLDLQTGKSWLPARTSANSYNSRLRFYTVYWWMDHLCRSPLSLQERMIYFFHTHFTTMQSRVNYASAMYYQLELFRQYAFGNIKQLALKLCFDNAMLMHLDGRYNRVGKPNENFAREFLELYTIGKGTQKGANDYTTYTEQDVREAARVFSGFDVDPSFSKHIDPDTGLPRGTMISNGKGEAIFHDYGSKTFSSAFGGKTIHSQGRTHQAIRQEIGEFVDMIFDQPATAQHLCRKLYRFFVYHQITPGIESQIIRPLAQVMIDNDYELRPVLTKLLSSQHFYEVNTPANGIGGTLIKSPLELFTQMFRYYNIKLPSQNSLEDFYTIWGEVFYRMQDEGMQLYEPVEVAGYPAYHQGPDYNRNWITSSTLARRYILGKSIVTGIRRKGVAPEFTLDVMAYVKNTQNITDPSDAPRLVRELAEDLIPRPVSEERMAYFLEEILLDSLSPTHWTFEWEDYLQSGNDRGVRRQLELLFTKIMESPEYQLF